MTHGMAKTYHDALIRDLQNAFFSLNVDKSISMNNKQILSVLVNYCTEGREIITKHLSSFEETTKHSSVLY